MHKRRLAEKSQDRPKKRLKIDQRFKFSSATQQLQAIELSQAQLLSWSKQSHANDDTNALAKCLDWGAQTNATVAFYDLLKQISPYARSLPLILHHRLDIFNALLDAMRGPDFEIIADVALEIIPALFDTIQEHDLLEPLLKPLIHQLEATVLGSPNPKTIEKAIHALAYVFKTQAKPLAADYKATWELVKDVFMGGVEDPALASQETGADQDVHSVEEDFAGIDEGQDAASDDGGMDVVEAEPALEPDAEEDDVLPDLDDAAEEMLEEAAAKPPALSAPWPPLDLIRARSQPHLRHLLASAFAYVVRRIPNDSLADFARLLYDQVDPSRSNATIDSAAWIISEALKSVNRTLYIKAGPMFKAFAEAATTERSLQALHQSLTSTLHYTTVQHSLDLGMTLIDISQTHARYVTLLEILLGTRKGNRVPEDRRPAAWDAVERIVSDDESVQYQGLLVMAFMWATPAESLSRGPGLFKALYESKGKDLRKAQQVTLALHRLQFTLYEHFCVSSFFKTLLESDEEALALVILAEMQAAGAWRDQLKDAERQLLAKRIRPTLEAQFNHISHVVSAATEQQFQDLFQSLLLSDICGDAIDFPEESGLRLVDAILALPAESAKAQYQKTPFNAAAALARLLRAIEPSQIGSKRIVEVIQVFGWHVEVLQATEHAARFNVLSFEDLVTLVKPYILSEFASHRQSAVQLLRHASPAEFHSLLNLILQIEQVPLTFQQARERTMLIRRLGRVALGADPRVLEIALLYLVASLKINFKALWKEAISVIVELAPQHSDQVWAIVSEQLQVGIDRPDSLQTSPTPEWAADATTMNPKLADLVDVSFECKNVNRLRKGLEPIDISKTISRSQMPEDRLVYMSYEIQLLALLGELPTLSQRHSRVLVPLFLTVTNTVKTTTSLELTGKEQRERTCAWLILFAKLHNPKSFFQTELYAQTIDRLLTSGSPEVQKNALACALTWKDAHVTPYAETLTSLLETSAFRDTLLKLPLSPEDDVIATADRPALFHVLMRLFFGMLISKASIRSGRHTAILSALRACQPDELDLFVQLMLAPQKEASASRPHRAGFLNLLQPVLKHIGDRISYQLPALLDQLLEIATLEVGDKLIRRLAIKRLLDFFRCDGNFDSAAQMPKIFEYIISPKLERMQIDNSQDPTVLFDLALAWLSHQSTLSYLSSGDDRFIPTLIDSADRSLGRALDFTEALCDDTENTEAKQKLLQAHSQALLTKFAQILDERNKKGSLADASARRLLIILQALARSERFEEQASQIVPLLLRILAKQNKIVPERFKTEALRSLHVLAPLLPITERPSALESLIPLFSSLRFAISRSLLVQVYRIWTADIPSLARIARLVIELNAFSTKRPDQPDFDRRLAAFAEINEELCTELDDEEWRIIVLNGLFYIQDEDELSLRNSASVTLRRFFAASARGGLEAVFDSLIYPALKLGVRKQSELVRSEYLHVLSAAVEAQSSARLKELEPFLMSGEEEANIFINIGHVQQHRRIRAMKRLGELSSNVPDKLLLDFCVPLTQHWLPNPRKPKNNPNSDLVQQAILTFGDIMRSLSWPHYKRLLGQQIRVVKKQDDPHIKIYTRLLVSQLRAFHFDMTSTSELSQKILDFVNTRLLNSLFVLVETRAEDAEVRRIAVAEGIVPIILALPHDARLNQMSRLLMNLSQALRSRDQSVRDDTRKALIQIMLLDPSTLPQALQELTSALTRGSQKHILAFVLHSFLVALSEAKMLTVSNATLERIVGVLKDDLFGSAAIDRDSNEFRQQTHMKEVKSSKSVDSFVLLASSIDVTQVSILLQPIRDVLEVAETNRTGRLVDDLLSRIAISLQQNSAIDIIALLNLCTSLLKQNTQFLAPKKQRNRKQDQHTVVFERQSVKDGSIYERNAYRFVGFGLDLLAAALRHNRLDLHDTNIKDRLEAVLPAVGNALYTVHDSILLKALKILAILIRCNLDSSELTAPLLTKQVMKVLDRSGNAQSEVGQAALRSLASMLRDTKSVTLTTSQLTTLLKIITTDLEEGGDAQAIQFNVLRAVMDRKFAAPELYDLMDRISDMLVTSQSSSVRETCRSIFLAFILDYPQTKGRLQARFTFLSQQLQYIYESGRLSVLEILHALITKLSADLISTSLAEGCDTLFVGLVLVLANDESSKCKEAAAALLPLLLGRMSSEQRSSAINMLLSWAQQDSAALRRTSFQIFGAASKELALDGAARNSVMDHLRSAIEKEAITLAEDQDSDENEEDSQAFQLPYHALVTLGKFFAQSPDLLPRDPQHTLWASIRQLLAHSHIWVQNASSRITSMLLTADGVSPLVEINFALYVDVAMKHVKYLRSSFLTENFASQVVKNLFLLVKLLHSSSQVVEEEKDEAQAFLPWLSGKLSKQAVHAFATRPSMYESNKTPWALQTSSVLKWIAAITQFLPVQELAGISQSIISPLYRIANETSNVDDHLKTLQGLASEVQEMVQQKLGETAFVAAYGEVQRAVDEQKASRRQKAALLVVSNPEKFARQKEKRSKAKSESRKRKTKAFAEAKERFNEEPRKRIKVREA